MLQDLDVVARRIDEFNAIKIERALEVMDPRGRQVFRLLPLLLHLHHLGLPGGEVAGAASGIAAFEPSEEQVALLCKFFPELYYQPQALESEILALYSMGSTASIGQCYHSDLDLWICHANNLPDGRLHQLELKCRAIEMWARSFGVEVNFFLIPQDKFRRRNQAPMLGESCGSAQHLLLLDEFYRTATRLAGKRLVWRLVPVECHDRYDEYVEKLFASGFINENEWFDLGEVTTIPAEEYFGATLWQLYKGIDSPYKAVLKTILMEAYSYEYPNTRLISFEIKNWLQHNEAMGFRFDGYAQMLERVTNYLKSIGDLKRLDLVRRCFYLKVCDGLSDHGPAWRRRLLVRLVSYWGWDDERLRYLDRRPQWKVSEVKAAYAEILEALMHSYRNLLAFARRNQINDSINSEDIGVLSRKLYAAFETLPGKVQRINLKIAPDLSEPSLTFIQVPKGHYNPEGWYLYKQPLEPLQIIGQSALEHNSYISKLVAWTHFNGLLTPQTELHLYNQGSDLYQDKLEHFCRDLVGYFPIQFPAVSNQALSGPCEIKDLAVFLNLEFDPCAQIDLIENDEAGEDLLSYGPAQLSLVGSIDLIYRNSWNEIRTLNFRGEDSLINALLTILGKMHQDAAPPERLEIFNYSSLYSNQLKVRVEELIVEAIELRRKREQQVKTVVVGKNKYALFFERRGVTAKKLENAIDFYLQISASKSQQSQLRATADSKVLEIAYAYASEGLVQFFFESINAEEFNVYLLDAENQVEIYRNIKGAREELVQSVNRHYTSQTEDEDDLSAVNFNLPQYYDILDIEGNFSVVPYRTVTDVAR